MDQILSKSDVELIGCSGLLELLLKNSVNASSWKYPESNTVDDLFKDIINGDCEIIINPLKRLLRVVKINIYKNGKILIEDEVSSASGRYQKRGGTPAEKMKKSESAEEAAYRGILEELSVSSDRVKITSVADKVVEYLASGPSYPGLASEYHIYHVFCEVEGLPSMSFKTTESVGSEQLHDQVHSWVWVDIEKYS